MRRAPIAVVAVAAAAFGAQAAEAQDPVALACAPGTPSALRFDGLPPRVERGREEAFSFDHDDVTWAVGSGIAVTVSSGDRVLFQDTVDELTDIPIRLELADGPAAVTAAFDQSSGTVTCLQTIAAETRGYRHFRMIDRCDAPSFRPRRIIIACGDGGLGLKKLRWRGWNRARASARGVAYANDCKPYCAAGHFHDYRVRVRASRPRILGGGYAYTRLRISYPGARPPGAPRVDTLKAAGDGDFFFWR